ncbi:CBS domain-containing protein [Hathewaya limosa]|uniref:CBS domain-containing protein n=1 Tax=Hathewaya limosa TaxID=1536 RepID=A0ABU0JRE5_HATLI|nr:CBS domain-containing protein [Hathewaya limosa]MDQ0478826.1 CBS domain-containing protein [Hathewaya limosa]
MNIAFFLTPKIEVVFINENYTLEKAMHILEKYKYTAIPIIDEKGKYVGTLTEGDVLWYIKNKVEKEKHSINQVKNMCIKQIPRRVKNSAVKINSDIEGLITLSISQNFVPVVDDDNVFIGIIKRSVIINYCYNQIKEKQEVVVNA